MTGIVYWIPDSRCAASGMTAEVSRLPRAAIPKLIPLPKTGRILRSPRSLRGVRTGRAAGGRSEGRSPRAHLASAHSGGLGPRPLGTMTQPRGARCTGAVEAFALADGAFNPRGTALEAGRKTKRKPEARSRGQKSRIWSTGRRAFRSQGTHRIPQDADCLVRLPVLHPLAVEGTSGPPDARQAGRRRLRSSCDMERDLDHWTRMFSM